MPTKTIETRPVRLDLTAAEHALLRVAAARADMSMSRYVREIVLEKLRREESAKSK